MKKILQTLFSVKIEGKYKIFRIMGFKLNFKADWTRYLKESDKVHLAYLETHLVDHCNLNCRGCTHFCPVTPETFIDVKKFKNDIFELAKKSDIAEIRLMGGEPLLHPDVCEFIKVTRQAFPESNILLLTNGILLKTMSNEFWETLRENRITIEMTHYPVVKDFESYLNLVRENNVNLGAVHIVDDFLLMFNQYGNSNIKKTFKECPNKTCVNLKDGKLVVCPTACYMHRYNEYFKTNIPAEEGIEVSSNSAIDIFKYLKTPINTCSYCVSQSKLKFVPWSISKKEPDEWYSN